MILEEQRPSFPVNAWPDWSALSALSKSKGWDMCHSFLLVYYWNDTEFLTLSLNFRKSMDTVAQHPGVSRATAYLYARQSDCELCPSQAGVPFSLTLVFQFFRELLVRLLAFCPVTHCAAALPTASFDSSVRKVLCNPHLAAIDVKKPAVLVLCGLSELH